MFKSVDASLATPIQAEQIVDAVYNPVKEQYRTSLQPL